jgi:hypothetical protein
MRPTDPYNQLVRSYFFKPAHAGALSRDHPLVLHASASESGHGASIVLAAGVAGDTIGEMRFLARGCPHLIAAAEGLCKEREQGAVTGLCVFALAEMLQRFAIPVEKTGRILLLEDALRSLWAQYESAD